MGQVNIPERELQQLEQQAARRGYPSAGEYLRALLEADAARLEDDDDDLIVENFRAGWEEVMRGELHPARDVLKAYRDER